MITLTEREAFDAMREFLDRHYRRTGGDEIGGLLGDMEPMPDGLPADHAAYDEWKSCIETVRGGRGHRDAAE